MVLGSSPFAVTYLIYLNELIDEYNNTYHFCLDEKPIDADYSTLTEVIEASLKALKFKFKFKVGEIVRIKKYKKVFRKGSSKHLSKDSVVKTDPWMCKIKDLNREKIIGNFYEKKLLLSKLKLINYSERNIDIRDKLKVVLESPKYGTKKN